MKTTFRFLPAYSRFRFLPSDEFHTPAGPCIKLAGSLIEEADAHYYDWGVFGDPAVELLDPVAQVNPKSRTDRGRAAILGALTSSSRAASVHHSPAQLWQAYSQELTWPRRKTFSEVMASLLNEKLVRPQDDQRARVVHDYGSVGPGLIGLLAGDSRSRPAYFGFHLEPSPVRITGQGILAAIRYGVCKI